jgi:hypothetical protein
MKPILLAGLSLMFSIFNGAAISIQIDLTALLTSDNEGYIAFDLRWEAAPESPLSAFVLAVDSGHETHTSISASDTGGGILFSIYDPMRTGGGRESGPITFGSDRLASHLDFAWASPLFSFAPIPGEPWGMRVVYDRPDLTMPSFNNAQAVPDNGATVALLALGFVALMALARRQRRLPSSTASQPAGGLAD